MQADKIDLKEVMPLFSPVYDPECIHKLYRRFRRFTKITQVHQRQKVRLRKQ